MTRFLPLAGTHGWRGQPKGGWWRDDSPWLQHMAALDCAPYNATRPFLWSTDLDGFSVLPWRWGRSTHREWYLAAHNLWAYLVPPVHQCAGHRAIPGAETRIVAHSHGGQVALIAASLGLRIHTLITVCTPARDDLAGTIALARPNIRYWLHIHSDGSDKWQWFGGLGDGKFGIQRQQAAADDNKSIPRAGHTGVLEDPKWFGAWEDEGWLEVLRG